MSGNRQPEELQTRPTLRRLTDEGLAIEALLRDSELDKDALTTALDQVEGAWLTKIENIAYLINEWNSISGSIIDEIDRLQAMKKSVDNRRQWLSDYTLWNMIEKDEKELIFGGIIKVSIAKNNPSVEVIDETEIPSAYQKIVTSIQIDKNAILAYYRSTGLEVKGVRIVTDRKRLVVK